MALFMGWINGSVVQYLIIKLIIPKTLFWCYELSDICDA